MDFEFLSPTYDIKVVLHFKSHFFFLNFSYVLRGLAFTRYREGFQKITQMGITRQQLIIMTSMSGMKERSFHDLSIDVLVGGAVACLC